MNNKDISYLFNEDAIKKFHLGKYNDFEELQKEKNSNQSFKDILFVETYKTEEKEFRIYKEEFDKLSIILNNSEDKEDELN